MLTHYPSVNTLSTDQHTIQPLDSVLAVGWCVSPGVFWWRTDKRILGLGLQYSFHTESASEPQWVTYFEGYIVARYATAHKKRGAKWFQHIWGNIYNCRNSLPMPLLHVDLCLWHFISEGFIWIDPPTYPYCNFSPTLSPLCTGWFFSLALPKKV